jgi:hypothetical protein
VSQQPLELAACRLFVVGDDDAWTSSPIPNVSCSCDEPRRMECVHTHVLRGSARHGRGNGSHF